MVSQTVAELLADHVRLTVEGIDRMYLNVYVPRLQCAYGAVSFLRDHRGQPVASSALMSPRFVSELDRFIARAVRTWHRVLRRQRRQRLVHKIADRPQRMIHWHPRLAAHIAEQRFCPRIPTAHPTSPNISSRSAHDRQHWPQSRPFSATCLMFVVKVSGTITDSATGAEHI